MSGTCGTARRPSPNPCNIRAEVRNRNGQPRWWCDVHGAPAWGPHGERLERCPGYGGEPPDPNDVLRLDPREFAGGVGIWGALSPVYCTGPVVADWGVHVHARLTPEASKVIDRTYALVRLVTDDQVIEIDAASATAAVVANVFGFELKTLRCPHCNEMHLDREEFGASPHRKHQCNRCGRAFFDPDGEPSISNPVAGLRGSSPAPVPSQVDLVIRQSDFPGGVAIWGSNPALLWTSDRPETEGLHVHARSTAGEIVIDDTYRSVVIDGVELDDHMARILMVQQSLAYLRARVVAVDCPSCSEPHFDDGQHALHPHVEHLCSRCGATFSIRGRRRLVVCNPIVSILEKLALSARGWHSNPAA